MRSRPLGATGLTTSEIGLGLAALGRPGYINLGRQRDLGEARSVDALRKRTFEVLDAAWAAGARYLDTARSYGLAESFLADWLTARAIAPGDVVVGSKWGYTYTADWRVGAADNEVKDHSLGTLERQLAESQGLLGPWLGLIDAPADALAIGAVLAQPWVACVLSGAVTPSQLRTNVAGGDIRLGSRHISALDRLAEDPDTYWRTRSGLAWA